MTKLRRILKSPSHRSKAGDNENCSDQKLAQRDQKPNKRWPRFWAFIFSQSTYTIVTTLATVAIALYAIKQFHVTKTQRDIMARQDTILQRQTRIMDAQTSIMSRQAEISEIQAQVENSANVVVYELYLWSYGFDSTGTHTLEASLINTGRTPAYDVSAYTVYTTDSAKFRCDDRNGRWFIMPTYTLSLNKFDIPREKQLPLKLTGPQADSVNSGLLPLYAYLCVTYRDFLNHWHTTTLCRKHNPQGSDESGNPRWLPVQGCETLR